MKKKKRFLSLMMAVITILTVMTCAGLSAGAATMPSCSSLRISNVTDSAARVDFNINNPSRLKITTCGMQIRRKYAASWTTKTETITKSAVQKMRTIPVWYTVGRGKEFGFTLTPGTEYEYRGYCKYNNRYYYTNTACFRTPQAPDYMKKATAFINDARFKNGVTWGDNQRPKLSAYSSRGCCAYCADFTKYVFNRTGFGTNTFTSVGSIKKGDVLYITSARWGVHWIVVLDRSGNKLYTAEGNVLKNGKHVTKVSQYGTYSISGKGIYSSYAGYYTFLRGYHQC